MKGTLSKNQIDYILYHLNFFVEINKEIKKRIIFSDESINLQNVDNEGEIVFSLSKKELNLSDIFYIDDIPYLFPNSNKKKHFEIKNQNLIFSHDIIKSAFYLLSGYQEQLSGKRDKFDRFPLKESLQFKGNFISKPLVNYYFQIIINGLKQFGEINNIKIIEKKYFQSFGFILSHDIDRVQYYSVHQFKFLAKAMLGLSNTGYSRPQLYKAFYQSFFNLFFLSKDRDPFWNFEWLLQIEKKYDIKSTFYFLLKGIKHQDAYFNVKEDRIKNLINFLHERGCEIGVHGTVNSYNDENELKRCLNELNSVTPEHAKGIRQHRLRFNNQTFKIQENVGLMYDSTLGFAEHEGFRNSFCFPFKPYNFEEDKMMNIWEIPLMVMDVTLFNYRNLSFSEAQHKIEKLIEEVIKFNGVFTLLWHNSFFDEIKFPGIKSFYVELLKRIKESNPDSNTALNILNKITERK